MGNRLAFIRFFNGVLLTAFAVATAWGQSHLGLDDGGGLQNDNEINEARWNSQFASMNASFDNQIAAQKNAIDRANALKDQCKNEKDVGDISAKQQKTAATVQALTGLAAPVMQTAGSAIERAKVDVAGNTKKLTDEKNEILALAKSESVTINGKNEKALTVKGDKVIGNANVCDDVPPLKEGASGTDIMVRDSQIEKCRNKIRELARDANDQIRERNTQLAALSQAGGQLLGHSMQLAAAGLGGVLAVGMSGSQNKAQGKVSGIQLQSCMQQAAFQIADAERKLQELEKKRAQQMLDMNIAKAADDLARKRAREAKSPVAVVQSNVKKDPKTGFPFPKSDGGGGAPGGGGASGGGSAGGGGGSPQWGFNQGGEGDEPGGSSLPVTEDGTSFAGEGAGGGGDSGGFGTFGEKPAEAGPEPAAVDGEEAVAEGTIEGAGDGGLDTMMIRMRNIHAKYASTLLQSQDLSQVATGIKNPSDL